MAEKIEVFIRPSQTFQGLGHHMWAVYTNAAGQQFSLSGWSNTRSSFLGGWGTLDTQVTEWGPKSWDWAARSTAVASDVVATGANLSAAWNSMTQCATAIDNANLR